MPNQVDADIESTRVPLSSSLSNLEPMRRTGSSSLLSSSIITRGGGGGGGNEAAEEEKFEISVGPLHDDASSSCGCEGCRRGRRPHASTALLTSSNRYFSKRLSSDLSEEAQGQRLTPAGVLESKRKSQRLLPVTRLRFSSLGLVGRDDEKQLLEACLKRVAAAASTAAQEQQQQHDDDDDDDDYDDPKIRKRRELVFISGEAGTGKTALAHCMEKSVERLCGLYVKGKFDLCLRDEPYSGIAAACREICGRILLLGRRDDDESFLTIRQELLDKLGSENLGLLIHVVPELVEIVGDEVVMNDVMKTKKKQGSEESKARFNYAFRVFFRLVASHFSPLVILLDDIQWSDAATLDLLKVLIADRDNAGLMMIGVYRSNEVDETHSVSRLIREMKRIAEQDDFNLTEVEIGNLDTSQTNEILMRLLSIDEPSETLGLANICQKRSLGNIFALLAFLEMLQAEGLLHFHLFSFRWGWDEPKILSETSATSNVVDLMKRKIEKLPASVSERLSIAACLGFSFEPAVLNIVWGSISRQNIIEDNEGDDIDIAVWISIVEKEGLLEAEQDRISYRWVHDKVQEAAMSLVRSDSLPSLKAQVGKILVDEFDETQLDSYIFTIVNLLHEGPVPEGQSERIELSKLSLQASKKAGDLSAFESAGKYADIGVKLLPKNKWTNHYSLTLDLYSTAAEAACYLGNLDELGEYYNEVLFLKDHALFDKLRVYHAMISYIGGALGRPNDAVKLIVEILAQFGIRFPKLKCSRLVSTVRGALKVKKRVASLRPEDIATLPAMDDPVHLEMMRLLDQLFLSAYLAKNDILPLSILASTKLTLDFGLSEYSAPAFAGLALVLGASGDMALASQVGRFAQLAMDAVECKNMDARAEMFLNGFVFCWTGPIARMTPRLLQAYETGLSVGDNENACWSIGQYIVMCIQSGNPLERVEADCKLYLKQMLEFKRETVHADISIYFEMVCNLMGQSDGDPTVMKSEQLFLSHSDHTVLGVFYSCKCILYLYFGEYEKAAKLAIERGDTYAKGIPSHSWIMTETFARGMSLYAMARMTRKRLYTKHAKKVHMTIKSWLRKDNPNVKHYDSLFNAESAALSGRLDAAEKWYQDAIVTATRQGRIHESAFASERHGEFLLHDRNDPEEARCKFEDALRRYGEWGATRKVHMLREKHRRLWRKPSEVVISLPTNRN